MGPFISPALHFSQEVKSILVSGIWLQLTENTIQTDPKIKGGHWLVEHPGKAGCWGSKDATRIQLSPLPGCAFLQVGLILKLHMMKNTCLKLQIPGSQGSKSTKKESLFPEVWTKVHSLILKEPARVVSTPDQSQCLGRLQFTDALEFDSPVHPRYQRWSQPHSNQMDWE